MNAAAGGAAAAAMMFLPIIFLGVFCIFGAVALAFWIWMLVDCITKEPAQGNDKVIWILVIVLTHALGALIYFLVRRPQRIKLYGQ